MTNNTPYFDVFYAYLGKIRLTKGQSSPLGLEIEKGLNKGRQWVMWINRPSPKYFPIVFASIFIVSLFLCIKTHPLKHIHTHNSKNVTQTHMSHKVSYLRVRGFVCGAQWVLVTSKLDSLRKSKLLYNQIFGTRSLLSLFLIKNNKDRCFQQQSYSIIAYVCQVQGET